MGGVVAGMPGVECDGFGERLAAVIGVFVAALPLVAGEGAEEDGPAGVEALDEVEGGVYRGSARVVELGPEFFVVALDHRPFFSEGEARADVGIHVTVGNVVDELADGPAAFTVGRVELGVAEAVGGGAEILRQGSDGSDVRGVVGEIGFCAAEFADGKARIDCSGSGGGCAHTPQGTPLIRGGQGGGHTGSELRQKLSAGAKRGWFSGPGALRQGGGSACRCAACGDGGYGDAKTQKRTPQTGACRRGGEASSW
jgi:hypothetical protein